MCNRPSTCEVLRSCASCTSLMIVVVVPLSDCSYAPSKRNRFMKREPRLTHPCAKSFSTSFQCRQPTWPLETVTRRFGGQPGTPGRSSPWGIVFLVGRVNGESQGQWSQLSLRDGWAWSCSGSRSCYLLRAIREKEEIVKKSIIK